MDHSITEYFDRRLDRLEKKVDALIDLEIEVGRLAGINDKVESLMKANWMQTGAIATISALITSIITIYVRK